MSWRWKYILGCLAGFAFYTVLLNLGWWLKDLGGWTAIPGWPLLVVGWIGAIYYGGRLSVALVVGVPPPPPPES